MNTKRLTIIAFILLVIALIVLFLLPSRANAQTATRFCELGGANGRVLNAVPLNGSAASRTFKFGPTACQLNVASFRWLVIEADFTHTTNGNIIFTCKTGQSMSAADKVPQICAGAGTCVALDGGIVSKAVTGNAKWAARIGIRGFRAWSCVASHDNAPGAGDILTTRAYLTD